MADGAHVLLVDDEPDFQEALGFWFTSKGYRVSTASSGQEALDLIRATPPDIVFLDVNMPGLDGFETLRRLRTFDKALPVILVTAAVQEDNRFAGAKALGIAGLFPKGSSLNDLTQVLNVALRRLRPQTPSTVPAPAAASSPPPAVATAPSWWQRILAIVRRPSP